MNIEDLLEQIDELLDNSVGIAGKKIISVDKIRDYIDDIRLNMPQEIKQARSIVAEKADISKKDAEKAVSAVFDTIVEKVAEGEDVRIVGFGVFERHERKERIGSNPRTGDPITIPASNVPAFKAGKVFRNAVSEK